MDKGENIINRSTQGSKTTALKHMLTSLHQDAVMCYLEEKWLYLNSRRKWAKHLPRAAFEAVGADQMRVRRVINRSPPVKTMFMGVLTCLISEQNFNGLIVMEQLSRQHILPWDTHWQQFMVSGPNSMMTQHLPPMISNYYGLGDDVAETMCFQYQSYVRGKWVRLSHHDTIENKVIRDEAEVAWSLTINDIHLSCFLEHGTIIEHEVNCDCAFMLQNLPPVGTEIHHQMQWVPREQPVILMIDMQGGMVHGKQVMCTQED